MLSSTSGIYTAWRMTLQWRYTWPRCDSLRIASHIPRIVYWSALRPALSHSGTVSTYSLLARQEAPAVPPATGSLVRTPSTGRVEYSHICLYGWWFSIRVRLEGCYVTISIWDSCFNCHFQSLHISINPLNTELNPICQ